MAEPRRWFDPTQPQTLQNAVILCYIIAAFAIVFLLVSTPNPVSLFLGVAGYGVANERRWGYWLGIALAGLNVILWLLILYLGGFNIGALVNLAFMVALLALFLHPHSREYQSVWFK
jgi:hypothetical protein